MVDLVDDRASASGVIPIACWKLSWCRAALLEEPARGGFRDGRHTRDTDASARGAASTGGDRSAAEARGGRLPRRVRKNRGGRRRRQVPDHAAGGRRLPHPRGAETMARGAPGRAAAPRLAGARGDRAAALRLVGNDLPRDRRGSAEPGSARRGPAGARARGSGDADRADRAQRPGRGERPSELHRALFKRFTR